MSRDDSLPGQDRLRALLRVAVVLFLAGVPALADNVERVSVSSSEVQDNTGASIVSYITPNGRFVVFQSTADNLVPGDTGDVDVFVRDRWLGTTSLVSVPDPGTGNTNASGYLGRAGVRYCSDDGRHVVFVSASNTLVNGDTNGDPPWHIDGTDIFVRDRDLDADGIFDEAGVGNTKTVRVSVKTNGSQYIEYVVGVDTYGGGVSNPSISATGRFVAFESQADNLTTGSEQGTIGSNIYWHDRDNDGLGAWDQIGPVCITAPPFCITAEGSVTELVSKVRCCSGAQFDSFCRNPAISGDGRFVAFSTSSKWLDYNFNADASPFGDENDREDVYVRDMWSGAKAVRVSLDSGEVENNDQGSGNPSISHDGRYVAFTSLSSQLVSGDNNTKTDVFVRDRDNDNDGSFDELGSSGLVDRAETYRVSLGYSDGASVQLNDNSSSPSISANGEYVAFVTTATNGYCFTFCFPNCNLVCWTATAASDILVRDTVTGVTSRGSMTDNGGTPDDDSTYPSVADDGATLAFVSVATNILAPDANGAGSDVYVRVPPSATVVGRHAFYNNSFYDAALAGSAAPCQTMMGVPCNDDTAVATDKTALLPGMMAGLSSYISYTKGINGIMIDIQRAAGSPGIPAGPVAASNFEFRINPRTLAGFLTPAAAPSSITATPHPTLANTDRIKIIWPDNAIPNTNWLKVTVKSNLTGGALGLATDDFFYFGLAIGDGINNVGNNVLVNINDQTGPRPPNAHTSLNRAAITDEWDFDRNSLVDINDQIVPRPPNATTSLNCLVLGVAP